MKVPAAVLALALALALGPWGLEGAAVRREAEPPSPAPAPALSKTELEAQMESAFEALGLHLETLSDYFTQELPDQLQAKDMKQQAKVYLERARQQFSPLAQELHSRVFNFFSQLLDTGKRVVQPS
ncbi:apolipoprotein A-II-like [Struthio camelus]|uniref:apolipoprotein A-II-like n=1 Tax=Struthio camelus TaxID=8801 RepID=UPI0036041AA1